VKIGGLNPFTLSDYPGKTAAVVFTQECNFRCPFCHNGSLLSRSCNLLSESEVLEFLRSRQGRLSGVVLSGGEPTLHEDLAAFIHQIMALGYRVKLDTNGSRPKVLERLIDDGLLDFIAMDIKAPWERYSRLTGGPVDLDALRESVDLIARSGIRHEFRTTVVPQLLTDDDLNVIKRQIPPTSPHRWQPFRQELAWADWLRGDEPHPQATSIHTLELEGAVCEH
jgi:pyruvate formate lyase activating enzyme